MEIKQITDKNLAREWNGFIIENSSPAAFLQSWQWGEFRQCLGEKILRLTIYEDNEIIALAQFFQILLPFGRYYLFCPRGPVIKFPISNPESSSEQVFQFPNKFQTQNSKLQKQIIDLMTQEIKKTAKQKKNIFVRFELPYVTPSFSSDWSGLKAGVTKPQILTHSTNPENTLLLDLTKSEQEILQTMHPKTRYNIRLAEKKEIKVRIMNYELGIKNKVVDIFYSLLKQTAKRDKIKIFSKNYYEKLVNNFNQLRITDYGLRINLFFAEYQNKILSAIIILGFGNTATYLHGASSNEHRNLMPNYAIQWAAIKWAKKQGYHWYDFWGIQQKSEKEIKSDWAGITRFKKGFVNEKTGREINYIGIKDFILDKKWYNLYRIGKIFK